MRKTSAKKDCDTLYNKITALQSRLRRKQEQKQANSIQALQSDRLQKVCVALEKLLKPECRDRIIMKIQEQLIESDDGQDAKERILLAQTLPKANQDFSSIVKQFVLQDKAFI